MSEKLVVCSVVLSPPPIGLSGLVQAWSVDSLMDNLRAARRTSPPFMPVAAFLVDPAVFQRHFGLVRLPQSVWLPWLARNFRDAQLLPAAQRAIFHHFSTLREDEAGLLMAEWELAAKFIDVQSIKTS